MKTATSYTVVLATVLAAGVNSQAPGGLQINTPPALVVCQPAAITFSGGNGPYFLSLLPGGQSTAAPIEQFPQQDTAGSFTWTVDQPAGTAVTLQVRDGSGAVAYSDQVTIQAGVSTSCLNGGASSASGATTSGASSASAASSGAMSGASSASGASSSGASAASPSAAAGPAPTPSRPPTSGAGSTPSAGGSAAPAATSKGGNSDSGAAVNTVGIAALAGVAIAGVVASLF